MLGPAGTLLPPSRSVIVPSPSRLDPDPAVPQRALDHHPALTTDGDPAPAATAQNASSTLCALTGTRTVEDALSPIRAPRSGSMTPSRSPSRTLRVRTTQHSSGRTGALT
ncbi:DUF5133 domain-containing protein [Streptomyces sp. NPDC092369]|uniref:DUF5133 domain-containing protein n=1 Tax=Streptomyces sp. NPDC092369 TaxID=3366015 RepID=UPI00380B26B4